jgi:hypothetical protein
MTGLSISKKLPLRTKRCPSQSTYTTRLVPSLAAPTSCGFSHLDQDRRSFPRLA